MILLQLHKVWLGLEQYLLAFIRFTIEICIIFTHIGLVYYNNHTKNTLQ